MVKFDVTSDEQKAIVAIAERAVNLAKECGVEYAKIDCIMDLTATHSNGTPLDLDRLLKADNFNFSHDVFGIRNHIDRETGKLTDFFQPRTAAK
jgi:hypothetical protein